MPPVEDRFAAFKADIIAAAAAHDLAFVAGPGAEAIAPADALNGIDIGIHPTNGQTRLVVLISVADAASATVP